MSSVVVRARRALRRRATLRGAPETAADQGFVLVYVLLVTMLVGAMVATVTMSSASNVVPTQGSVYAQAATSAARAGIQDYLAKLNHSCGSLPGLDRDAGGTNACIGLREGESFGPKQIDNGLADYPYPDGYSPTFSWSVRKVTDTFVRLEATGAVGRPGSSLHTTKVLVADITGGSTRNFTDYSYYSTFETQSPRLLERTFGPRTIALTDREQLKAAGQNMDPAVIPADGPNWYTRVAWNGAADTTVPQNRSSAWCSALWYDSDLNSSPGKQGRWAQASGLPEGYDWQENGVIGSGGNIVHDGTCQLQFSTGNDYTGPVYTRDAYLLSDGWLGGSGPNFGDRAYSGWNMETNPQTSTPYNLAPIGGKVAGPYWPESWEYTPLSLPDSVGDVINANVDAAHKCVYYGPTRVWLQGDFAYVTSPMTALNETDDCYGKAGKGSNVNGPSVPETATTMSGHTQLPGHGQASMYLTKVPLADTLIYVKNAQLTDPSTWQPLDAATKLPTYQPIFQLMGSQVAGTQLSKSAVNDTRASVTARWTSNCDGWLLGWLFCDQSGKNQAYFEKEIASWSTIKSRIVNPDGTLAGATTASLSADLQKALTDAFAASGKTLYTPSSPAPTPSGEDKIAYSVTFSPAAEPPLTTEAGCTTGTPSTAPDPTAALPSVGDPLFAQQTTATVTTQVDCAQKSATATVHRLVSGKDQCTHKNWLGLCDAWSYAWNKADVSQFDLSAKRKVTTTTRTIASASSLSFPLKADVTRYQKDNSGPGDVYVEGTLNGKVSLVSDNDVVVTGNMRYVDESGASDDAAVLVATRDVRVYHPVGCVTTTVPAGAPATTPGYCPNDITGITPVGKLWIGVDNFGYHASRQYTNLAPQLANLRIDAGVFALNGSFTTDNFGRGKGMWRGTGAASKDNAGALDSLLLYGGVYQNYHGPAGVQWEISGTGALRPTSGYALKITYDTTLGERQLPYVPASDGGNAADPWRIVATSTSAAGAQSGKGGS